MEQKTERLNKFLALQLGISRRQADELIEKGRISINEKTAQLGERFKEGDEIKLGEKTISKTREEKKYIIFNKPRGKKQGENETIYAILPKEFSVLKPVGRLDKDSSGILLLTNDGDFAFRMTHPKFRKVKEYLVSLDTPLPPIHQQMIADFGINLPDGKSQLRLERLDDSRKNWKVIMSEGRNRQIRRTFSAIGYEVEKLHRTVFGSYTLPKDLNFGDFRKVEKL